MRNTNAKIRNEVRRRYDTFLTNMLEILTISHPEVLELFKKNAVSDDWGFAYASQTNES